MNLSENQTILITSTMPDAKNSNSSIRNYVTKGFERQFPKNKILSIGIENIGLIDFYLDYSFILAIGSVLQDSVDLIFLKKIADKLSIPLIIWLHDDPYEIDFSFKAENIADLIFTNDKNSLEYYKHKMVYHMPLAGSKDFHFRKITKKNIDAFFAGVAYSNRLNFFKKLEKIYSDKSKNISVFGDWWEKDMLFCKNQRLSVNEFSNFANLSWFTFNLGRDFNLANKLYELVPSTPGPRTFEVALAGSAQLFFVDSLEILDYFSINPKKPV